MPTRRVSMKNERRLRPDELMKEGDIYYDHTGYPIMIIDGYSGAPASELTRDGNNYVTRPRKLSYANEEFANETAK
jgi:hypothetical protein